MTFKAAKNGGKPKLTVKDRETKPAQLRVLDPGLSYSIGLKVCSKDLSFRRGLR